VIASLDRPGPVYIRIGRGFEQTVYESADYGFEIGKAVTMHEGSDITVMAIGPCVLHALEAAKRLKEQDISVRVLNMHTIKPIDKEAVFAAVNDTRKIITVEPHNIYGGLGPPWPRPSPKAASLARSSAWGYKMSLPLSATPMTFTATTSLMITGSWRPLAICSASEVEEDEDWEDEI